MTVNLSGQPISLIIGGQNWSNWIDSISIGYGEYEMGSGLMPATGTIDLIFAANQIGVPSPVGFRANPTLWHEGQIIQISIGGSPLPCSGQSLKLLQVCPSPERSLTTGKVSLSIGCALAYEYFPPEPNDDLSGFVAGQTLDRGQIINTILGKLGITSAVVIPLYPIDYPLPKLEGNWLQFCGEIADSAGYYLRCNTAGVVVAEKILDNGSSGLTYQIGRDESDWQEIGSNSEKLVEKLIVTGVKKSLDPRNTEQQVTEEFAPIGKVLADQGDWNPIDQQIIEKRSTKSIEIINNTQSALGFGNNPSIGTFIIFQSERFEEPFGVIFPDLLTNNKTRLITSKLITIRQEIVNGTIDRVTETTQEPFGVIFPDAPTNNSSALLVSKKITKSWEKIGNQKWRETYLEQQPFGVLFPDRITNDISALSTAKETTTEGEGSPPTNQPPSEYTLQENQIKAEVFISQLAPRVGRQRQRTLTLPHAISEAQLNAYGQLFSKVLVGRSLGWRFATRLTTAILPMQSVVVNDNGIGYILRADAMQWALSKQEAYILFNGIEQGSFATATPEIVSIPYAFPMPPIEVALNAFSSSSRYVLEFAAELIDASYSLVSGVVYASLKTSGTASIDYSTFAYAALDAFAYSAIASATSLNDKILAYWKFDGTQEREYSPPDTAFFVIDEVNDPSVQLALGASSLGFSLGLIGNAMNNGSANIDPFFGGTLATLNPASNGLDFIGLSCWVKVVVNSKIISEEGGFSPNSTYSTTVYESTRYRLDARISTSDPVEVETMELSFRLNIFGTTTRTITVVAGAITDWYLVIAEITRTGFSLRINAGVASTNTYTEGSTSFFSFDFVAGSSEFDILIDEGFAFNETLSTGDITTIYNAGNGDTYPF